MVSHDKGREIAPTIQFLYFEGCPLADAAQTALELALVSCGMDRSDYEHVDVLDPATPANLAIWGSPTILVNGKDVTGHSGGDGVACRIYDTADQVPTVESITAAIHASVKA